jgi:hypothetical protein
MEINFRRPVVKKPKDQYTVGMTRGILIAGNESALCRAVEAEAAKRVEKLTSAVIQNRLVSPQRPAEDAPGRLTLDWNPGSPISARTLVLAAENRLEQIDEVILVCSPPSIRRLPADLSLADVEVFINDQFKGWFFLVKELARVFESRRQTEKKPRAALALVYNDIGPGGRDEAPDLLGPSALGSFRALTDGLLASAHNAPFITMGFAATQAGDEAGFAAFVWKCLDDASARNNGKLHRYGKFSFLQRGAGK